MNATTQSSITPQSESESETQGANGNVDETKIPLLRVLGIGTAIFLVVGDVIGTGVFKKISAMAATGLSEQMILIVWLVAGFITLCGAFTMAGLAKTTTASGGLYEYMRICFGDFAGFLFGWASFIAAYTGALAATAFLFAESVNTLVPLPDPLHQWAGISIGNFVYPFANSGIKIVGLTAMSLLTWFNCRGVRKGAGLNDLLTILKILG